MLINSLIVVHYTK